MLETSTTIHSPLSEYEKLTLFLISMVLCKKEGNYLHLLCAVALTIYFYSLSIMNSFYEIIYFTFVKKN